MHAKSESNGVEAEAEKQPAVAKRGMSRAFILLGLAYLTGIAMQHLLGLVVALSGAELRVWSVVVGLAAFTAVVVAGISRKIHRFFSSNRFSVPVVLVLTFLSIVGTMILQAQPEQVMRDAYGPALMSFIRKLFLDDIFHSFGFAVVMGMGAGGLALVVARRRKLTARYLGSLGAHVGLLVVLAGAAVGNVWGVKGRLNMHKGESSNRFFVPAPGGRMSALSLGFTVRLDDFKLHHYEPEFRLMVFEVEGDSEKRLASVDPAAADTSELGEYGAQVVKYWPDHQRKTVVEPLKEAGEKRLAALGLKGPEGADQWVFDGGGQSGGRLSLDGSRLAFFWDLKRAEEFLAGLAGAPPASPHVLIVAGREISVEVGKSYPVKGSGHSIEVLRALKDFVIDAKSRQPQNRSDKPNNPAIEVAILGPEGKRLSKSWLFAKFPDFHGQKKGAPIPGLKYRYSGERGPQSFAAITVGETAEVWRLEKGAVTGKGKLQPGEKIQLGKAILTIVALHPAVRRSFEDVSISKRANNPLVRVKVPGAKEPINLKPQQPVRLAPGKVLVLSRKEGETVRDYLSTLSVIDQEKVVKTETIEVNYPLQYGGYVFYQADYRPEDPTFSGFQVVRDPGLWLVYLGFIVNLLGVIVAVFGPTIVRRRRAARAAAGGGP